MLSSDFHCKESDGLWVVPLHPALVTSDYGFYEVGVTVCGVQHILGVRVQPQKPNGSVIFLTMKIQREN